MSLDLKDQVPKYAAKLTISLLLLLAGGVTAGVNLLFLAPLQKAGQSQILLQISTALLGLFPSYIFSISITLNYGPKTEFKGNLISMRK